MNDYITLKVANDATTYKLKVISPQFLQSTEQGETIDRAVDGALLTQVGYGYNTFQLMAKIDVPAPTGYLPLATLRAWRLNRTTAGRNITLTDFDGVVYQVRLVGAVMPQMVAPVTPYYYVQLQFVQQ